jgi:hypothetical protein
MLVAVAGGGKSPTTTVELKAQSTALDGDGTTRHYEFQFIRYQALARDALGTFLSAAPDLVYGEVNSVIVKRPDWASKITIDNRPDAKPSDIYGSYTVPLSADDMSPLIFDVTPKQSDAAFWLLVIANNAMWFTGTVIVGAMFAFLAPLPAHKAVRWALGILSVLVAAVLVSGAFQAPATKLFAQSYGAYVSLEIGLIVCITFFERLKDLVQLLGGAKA